MLALGFLRLVGLVFFLPTCLLRGPTRLFLIVQLLLAFLDPGQFRGCTQFLVSLCDEHDCWDEAALVWVLVLVALQDLQLDGVAAGLQATVHGDVIVALDAEGAEQRRQEGSEGHLRGHGHG